MQRTVDEIVNQIGRLSRGQRRILLRQMKAMGLLETDELLSDRNPLPIALAVPPTRLERQESLSVPESGKKRPPRPADRPRLSAFRSPVRGHTVLGSAGHESGTPSAMLPLPGQAPTEPICIVFDGGSRGNPGEGYGSFALDWPGQSREIVQLNFGNHVTNNEAEYDTLIAALEAVRDRLVENEIDPSSAALSIWGDSLLVCNQVRGEWKCKEPRMQVRLDKALSLLSIFGKPELSHQPREKSVEILGH